MNSPAPVPLQIRTAGPSDLSTAVRFIRQLWESHGYDDYDDARLESRTAEIMRDCMCYLAVLDGSPVAFASLQDQGDTVVVRHFAVEATARGQGLGRQVFDALEAHAFPGRASRLYASIDHEGPRAFWEKMGYSVFAYTMERKGVPG